MIGIRAVHGHICDDRLDNLQTMRRFEVTESFVRDKIGIVRVARKRDDQETSDLCVEVIAPLLEAHGVGPDGVECLILVTQNPDGRGLPHTAAIVHGKLGLGEHCAAFDISLGCSGYVYGLSAATAFMSANGMRCGLLVTADPYSKIVDPDDRDTAMLFGDAASVTLLTDDPRWTVGAVDFGTAGARHENLIIDVDGRLHMNGRQVFNFSATTVPASLQRALEKNGVTMDEVDQVILHQGSRYIVDTIARRMGVADKAPFAAADYGNTVSSSIPLALTEHLGEEVRTVLISGFGVGLSWASTVLRRHDAAGVSGSG